MKIITNDKVNFNSLEEEIYIKMMELGRNILQDKLRELDKLIKEYRDKDLFEIKDMQLTTIKSKVGEITISFSPTENNLLDSFLYNSNA